MPTDNNINKLIDAYVDVRVDNTCERISSIYKDLVISLFKNHPEDVDYMIPCLEKAREEVSKEHDIALDEANKEVSTYSESDVIESVINNKAMDSFEKSIPERFEYHINKLQDKHKFKVEFNKYDYIKDEEKEEYQ